MELTVLGVHSWCIKNENQPDKEGLTVHFFDVANHETSPHKIGVFPAKINADKSLLPKFTTLPGKYEFSVLLKPGAGGKSKAILQDVKLIPKS